jgi:hypothetical protein
MSILIVSCLRSSSADCDRNRQVLMRRIDEYKHLGAIYNKITSGCKYNFRADSTRSIQTSDCFFPKRKFTNVPILYFEDMPQWVVEYDLPTGNPSPLQFLEVIQSKNVEHAKKLSLFAQEFERTLPEMDYNTQNMVVIADPLVCGLIAYHFGCKLDIPAGSRHNIFSLVLDYGSAYEINPGSCMTLKLT